LDGLGSTDVGGVVGDVVVVVVVAVDDVDGGGSPKLSNTSKSSVWVCARWVGRGTSDEVRDRGHVANMSCRWRCGGADTTGLSGSGAGDTALRSDARDVCGVTRDNDATDADDEGRADGSAELTTAEGKDGDADFGAGGDAS
jgi:hypothetical protein